MEITVQARNAAFIEKITSEDAGMQKQAAEAVGDMIRVRVREDSYMESIVPSKPATDDMIVPFIFTDDPAVYVEREPQSPVSGAVNFGGSSPSTFYMYGSRFIVGFQPMKTARMRKDVNQLRTYKTIDIRRVFSDNVVKDLLADYDGRCLATVNAMLGLVGTSSSSNITSQVDVNQWRKFDGDAINRGTLFAARSVMAEAYHGIAPVKALCNNVTILNVAKCLDTIQAGAMAQKSLTDGTIEGKFLGCEWISTIKKTQVLSGSIYWFGPDEFIGKAYTLGDTTMYIKREAEMLEFYASRVVAVGYGNPGFARTDITGDYSPTYEYT